MRKTLVSTLMLIALVIGTLGQIDITAAQGGGLTPGEPVSGTLADESVSYTIDLTAGQLLIASLESDAFDAVLTIQDAGGMELASNDDGGEGTNSLLAFVAQADATYTLVAGAWSGGGDFVLTPNVVVPAQVEVGGSLTLAANGAEPLYAVFAGTAGSVVNMYATSQGDDDIQMALFGVDAQEIESDDDDGPGINPYLRRVVLPSDGLYLVEVRHTFDYDLTADVDVTVEATERLYVDATPQAVSLSDDVLGTEVYTFDAAAGTTYRIIVTSANSTGVSLNLYDTGDFFEPGLESGNAVRVAWDYLAPMDGTFRLVVHPSFFSEGDDYQVSVEVVQ